ncbi:MAG: NAD(P)H-dependent oxidoreductase [Halomonas sp.]|jgi:FMN-dependent NADH-azoreductase|uniref:FMN dependent NADH:quinone oxidoreductase n=1 Tax=Billgrantia tianxiuensis TaxID=2497861 RepID=A0A6I6SVU4_9GAMM|nr:MULTISPECIES: NAD(P)H-dependent oxidoreductase [Halomonas]MCE8033905.1 FMN-dependent NADH-azoreductase [Halomonas sp. MCCC 1A11057]MDX5432394.1 NAD(P)H-dependent oxidoreductase [Halomonas sp.]QHC51453.1 FMN-dependent NADH-azoreductase [Halomonas tianxiuensis]
MANRILLVTSSILGEHGQSNALASHLRQRVDERGELSLTHRDLAVESLPHLGLEELSSWQVAAAERSAEQQVLAQRSDELIDELNDHDVLVLAVPMYNFGIPSQLKAWFDRVMRAGVTFRYTEQGPVGLVKGKRAVILAARGGEYAGTELDTQTPHLKAMLGMIGISDVSVVYAEGLAMGEGRRDAALKEARQAIDGLVAKL